MDPANLDDSKRCILQSSVPSIFQVFIRIFLQFLLNLPIRMVASFVSDSDDGHPQMNQIKVRSKSLQDFWNLLETYLLQLMLLRRKSDSKTDSDLPIMQSVFLVRPIKKQFRTYNVD